VVKSNPDAPQLPVRRRARREGKTLYMAVPRLCDDKPFVRVDSDPTIKKAMSEGVPTSVEDLGHVDLVVRGTVAVIARASGSARAAASRTSNSRC
jgi:5-formyltetrahydrofolate cyclo-ligase